MTVAGLFGARAERDHQRMIELSRQDPELKLLIPDDDIARYNQEPGRSYQQIIARVLGGYGDRPAFAVRDYTIDMDSVKGKRVRRYLPSFRKISYDSLCEQVEAIAAAWQNSPDHEVVPGAFVASIAFTGAELNATDLATVYVGGISVPLQANLSPAEMMEIMADVAPVTLIISYENLSIGIDYALQQDSIKSVIIIDAEPDDEEESAALAAARTRLKTADGGRIAMATFAELVEIGRTLPYVAPTPPDDPSQALSMICYTSGSTGTPKGALAHEAICTQFWNRIPVQRPTVTLAYAPMNHFMGRIQVHFGLAQGGTVYFSLKSDLSTLLTDIRLARPTQLIFMPRFAELTYQHYLSEVQRLVLEGVAEAEADRQVRADMKAAYLGDRLIFGAVGSSPTAPEVRAFMSECFDIQLVNGYGSTEQGTGTVAADGNVNWNFVIDYKLRDVPELGYYTTDKPYPRGELVSKTHYQIKGYFKRPDATASIFDEDGYVLTGDIVEQHSRDHIEWLDRRNNVIKLSQAEFVAIGPLEAQYLANNPLFGQMYLYGSSYRAFLLAVVVPDVDYATSQLGHAPDDEELHAMVLDQLQTMARQAGLKSFEVPRDVLIDREPFTYENGLLTSARKPSRPNLKRRYADRLEAMYQEMDRKQQQELAQLRADGAGTSTLDRVSGAIKANLGLAKVDPESDRSYRDLGGDSLGAAALSALLEEMFGLNVPVSLILNPAGSVLRLAQFIDRSNVGESDMPSFASVHGEAPETVRSADLTLDRFFDARALATFGDAAMPAEDMSTVLLTGATGFLGRFLCLDWMEWLAPRGGKVICIIRARDAQDARNRIYAAIGTHDPALASRFAKLAAQHLEVIAGDLSAPGLGLDAELFARLTREVDRVVHCGALVNHVLSYQNLFEPNVIGTAELIRLALTGRQKPFDFISTVGVPMLSPDMAHADEDADPRETIPELPIRNIYAMGYAASKWACEVLLREAHDLFGLPVNIFRPDMILAHSRFRGQINVPDMFTRLLFSIVETGLAPRSFYRANPDGGRAQAHYDGLPADFVSGAIHHVGRTSRSGFHNYNVVNTNEDDGISLDTIIDWVTTAGYRVSHIDDHGEWNRRLAEKLRQLPEEKRQRSSLNILHSFAQSYDPRPERLHSRNFEAAVATSDIGPEVVQLSEAFIHKYLDDMVAQGLLERQVVLENI